MTASIHFPSIGAPSGEISCNLISRVYTGSIYEAFQLGKRQLC